MKTIIAGGRDYILTDADRAWLDGLKDSLPITEVVNGGAKGADMGGDQWARIRGLPLKRFPADWRRYKVSAGPRRNQQMADYAEACILFPGGKGTADMKAKAVAKGLRVIERVPPPTGGSHV